MKSTAIHVARGVFGHIKLTCGLWVTGGWVVVMVNRYAKGIVVPGLSTADLDRLVHEKIVQAGAYPSPLNYSGFPKSLTTSVNNVVCHGIPDDRPLESTDLINVDVSVYVGGFHGDCSTTVGLPELDSAGIRLLKCAEAALVSGIEAAVVGRRFNAIGKAIDTMVTAEGYQVCREFIGHGIGYEFHTLPDVHPCDIGAINGFLEPKIAPGMIFTIEPAVNEIGRAIRILDDRWTAVTIDGGRSAQFEHTIYVKEDGVPEILTTI
jgi:methionyl aminopeptidase